MRNNYVLSLDAESSVVTQQLQDLVVMSEESENKRIASLETKLKRATASKNMNERKLAKRNEILRRAKESLRRKEAEYEAARKRVYAAKEKMYARANKASACSRIVSDCEFIINKISAQQKTRRELLTEEELQKKAMALRFVMDQIDLTHPVQLKRLVDPSDYVEGFYVGRIDSGFTLSWRTTDIYIKDGFGGKLDPNFGKFDVLVLYFSDAHGTSSTKVRCTPVGEPNYGDSDDCTYYHPHLNGDGHACLGNLQQTILRDMGLQDIAQVIEAMSEFLQHYNKENPYIRLTNWAPNRWDNPVCESNQHLMQDCTCLRCGCCNSIVEQEDLSACGHCHSCCMVQHVHVGPSDLETINGSSCVDRNLYIRSTVENDGGADGQTPSET